MGGGLHGNFGKTSGMVNALSNGNNSSYSNPVKKLGDVRYNKNKMENYLLNVNHKEGGSKAKFFKETLGYKTGDGNKLHKNIVKELISKNPYKTIKTEHGLKHTFKIVLKGVNGKKIKTNVVAVIQKDKGRTTYKIITAYPDK